MIQTLHLLLLLHGSVDDERLKKVVQRDPASSQSQVTAADSPN
jgi:hypothetical protein